MFYKYRKYIYAIIIFYTFWLAIIPIGFRLGFNSVLNIINTNTEYNFSVTKPRIITNIIPNLKIKADSIKLLNKDNSEAFSIKKLNLNIRILPLITGKIHLNNFQCDEIKSSIFIKDKIYIGDYPLTIKNQNIKAAINRIKIKNINIKTDIENKDKYYINGTDLYYKETHSSLICHGKIETKLNNIISDAKFDINLPHNKNLKKTKFNIEIQNFNLNPLSKIVNKFICKDITSLNGLINIKSDNKKMHGYFTGIRIDYTDKNNTIIFPEKLKITSEYKIYENAFSIKKMELKSKNISAKISGEIKEIFTTTPKTDLKINIPKSDLRTYELMLPPIITEDISIPKLKEYPFYGDISGELKICGEFPEPDITGNIKVKNGVLINPIPNSKGGAYVDLNFTGKQFLLDVTVPAGGNEVVYVNGDVMLYGDKYAHLNVRSTKTVSLKTAENVVNPLHEILCFVIGPVPIMDISGIGNIDIKIEGTKKNPHIWGDFNFEKTSARFLEINNMELKNASGNLNFNNQKAHFINRTGTLHGQKATIDGTCTLFGELDFDVHANKQNLNDLVKILTTSPMLKDIKSNIPNLSDIKGKSDFYLHLTGKLIDINDLKLNENVIASGFIKLSGNAVNLDGIPAKNIKGIINYNKNDYDFDLTANITSTSPSKIKGKIKNNISDITINSPRIKVNELNIEPLKYLDPLYVKLNANYKGKLCPVEIGGINTNIEIIKDNKPVKNGKITSGKIQLKNSNLQISNLNGRIKQNPFKLNLNLKNIGKKNLDLTKSTVSGNFNCKSFDIKTLNLIKKANILPEDIQKELNKIEFISGTADISASAKNNYITKVNAGINISNADFEYMITGAKENITAPVKIISGNISVKNNILMLNKLNCLLDNMPVFIYGKITNFHKNPEYNINISSKFVQKVFNKYWNANNIYPIKINGDIICSTLLSGNKKHNKIRTNIKMEENSNIYYMGATIGDKLNPVSVNLDADIEKSGLIKLNNFKYNKIITSQNNKQNVIPVLAMNGEIKSRGKLYELKNLTIKTENPANANLFNIIFKKPTIKSGNFTSDIKINGLSNKPKIIGTLKSNNIEMPYLNTSIKDLSMEFKPDLIQITTNGNVLDNYIMVNANIKNNLTPPYKINGADIYINDFDIDNSLEQLKQIELKGLSSAIAPESENSNNDLLNSLILNNIKIRAGNIKVRNIKASNLEATCSLSEKMHISVDKFKFNMASGTIWGKVKYNLLNNYTQMELNSKNVNANELTIALFDLPNQIYGSLTGNIELSFNGTNDKTRLETLSGYGRFNVDNGKMPKLGSLEYLLRAGNLIKGGITGLTMNGIIDIISPMKTGEFSSINGRLRLKDGIVKTLEIRTIGKNLNLYIIGSLNLSSQMADLHVYGQLSKKVSTILGAAGNISLNTLFNKIPGISLNSDNQLINDLNKIPGIELSNKSTRRFIVEILGNISGDSFVKSFKWIN